MRIQGERDDFRGRHIFSGADWIAAGVIGLLSVLLLYGLQHAAPPLPAVEINSSAPEYLP